MFLLFPSYLYAQHCSIPSRRAVRNILRRKLSIYKSCLNHSLTIALYSVRPFIQLSYAHYMIKICYLTSSELYNFYELVGSETQPNKFAQFHSEYF